MIKLFLGGVWNFLSICFLALVHLDEDNDDNG